MPPPSQESTERYAALDLGSNSFHLLLAEFRDQRLLRLHTDRAMVRLAEGLDEENNLDPQIAERALEALRRFRPVLAGLPADHVRVVGTNTLRAAANADGFMQAAEAILGAPIEIISGIEEARLIYSGVMVAAAGPPQLRCVVDIGGGSTELVRGTGTPEQLQSLSMGCVSFSRRFFKDGLIRNGKSSNKKNNNFERARRAARVELQELRHLAQDALVTGASGTIKAVSKVLNGGELLDIERDPLDQLAKQVAATKRVEQLDLPHLDPARRPVFAAGLAILHGIFCELDIARMAVSPYAIREGIVHDLAGRLHGGDRRADTVAALMARWQIDPEQAQRVGDSALHFLAQLRPDATNAQRRLLRWAANLHQIGLALAHSKFRKLGAYMIEHADLAGFGNSEQEHLAYLVRNQRGDIKPVREHYGFHPDPALLLCLRLACILHRDHMPRSLEGLHLQAAKKGYRLEVSIPWLEQHPAIEDLLSLEVACWEEWGVELQLDPV